MNKRKFVRSAERQKPLRRVNVRNGDVLAVCKLRHRPPEFLSFGREINKDVSAKLGIHCICEKYGNSHTEIKVWLVARPYWHEQFSPIYSSGLTPVQRFFSLISDKAIRHGSFASVKQLVKRIDHCVVAYDTNSQPFKWAATADPSPKHCVGLSHI